MSLLIDSADRENGPWTCLTCGQTWDHIADRDEHCGDNGIMRPGRPRDDAARTKLMQIAQEFLAAEYAEIRRQIGAGER